MSADHHLPFHQVLAAELEDISRRRQGPPPGPAAGPDHHQPAVQGAPLPGDEEERAVKEERVQQDRALSMDLAGLALSGGGIRSATFALGVLQGLAIFGLLRRIDYLSTVSGGGYIGSWLAAWIKREGGILNVERQLRPGRVEQAKGRSLLAGAGQVPGAGRSPGHPLSRDEDPEPIQHLRAYSSYLTPRRGLFSADSWVLLAIYLRNILLNQFVVLPACVAVLLIPRLLERFFHWEGDPLWRLVLPRVMLASLLLALAAILGRVVLARTRRRPGAGRGMRIQVGVRVFHTLIVVPLFLAALLASWDLSWDLIPGRARQAGPAANQARKVADPAAADSESQDPAGWQKTAERLLGGRSLLRAWQRSPVSEVSSPTAGVLFFGTYFAVVVGFLSLLFHLVALVISLFQDNTRPGRQRRSRLWEVRAALGGVVSGLLAGFTGGALLYLGFAVVLKGVHEHLYRVAGVTLLGPPLVVGTILLSIIVAVGLLGTLAQEDEREWWASLCGWLLIDVAVWTVVVGISLFGPLLLVKAGAWGQALLGSGWLATALAGAWAGHSPRTGTGQSNRPLEILALVAPPIFLVGALTLIALLIDWGQGNLPGASHTMNNAYFQCRLMKPGLDVLFAAATACAIAAGVIALRVDVNVFSMHGLYADRLVRCYLGASRPKERRASDRRSGAPANVQGLPRRPDPVTGFDPNDDFPLYRLRIDDREANHQPYRGPYLLINTAMNLVQGDELAWQERKAESFVLTPRCCGSGTTGYSLLDSADWDPLRLGTAVTLSGAAVSPNMGYHSSPAVTALLTVFNVRLGGWVRNPRYGTLGNTGPWLGLLYLLKELFGRTNDRAGYVYLSDGGHFDNLGLYELVRRRCRFVIVCDAEEDPNYTFDALGAAIRKCYTDFGVRIEIDVGPIRPRGKGDFSRWHCAVGRIRYDEAERGTAEGVLVYLKASLTGNEPAEVQNYAREHPPFPHQPTLNQFFTESQFESYRALGCHIAQEVFGEAMQDVDNGPELDDAAHRRVVTRLFSNLHSRWFPPPPGFGESFLQSVRGYIQIERDLRIDPNLHEFSRALYPELGPEQPAAEGGADHGREKRRVELHLVSQMLQVMEDAWLGLRLEGYFAYPMNRGWMNTFRRWANSRPFRRYWPVLRGQFSKDFVRFCERDLRLSGGSLKIEPLLQDDRLLTDEPAQGAHAGGEERRRRLRSLREEFAWEWPQEEGLDALLRRAWEWAPGGEGGGVPSVWLLTLAPPGEPGQACGIILTWRPEAGKPELELVVWMRGSYRDLGLGRQGIKQVFEQIRDQPVYNACGLRTRYPRDGQGTRGEKMWNALWRTFFTFYGFRDDGTEKHHHKEYLVLRASRESWTRPL